MNDPAAGEPTVWLLDVDDTLLDTARAMRTAAPAAVQEIDPALSRQEAQEVGLGYCADPQAVFRRYARGEVGFFASRGLRLQVAYEQAGVRPPSAGDEPEAWGESFDRAFRPRFLDAQVLFDDVEPVLAAALARGVRVGLVTNASEALTREKLRRTVLAHFPFACVVTRDTLGYGKPDPRVFRHAAELAAPGVALGDVVYVGDEPDVDASAAREAGLQAVLLRRSGTSEEPLAGGFDGRRIASLEDLVLR